MRMILECPFPTTFLEKENLLVEKQNGFRKERACIDHIYSVYNSMTEIAGEYTYICFLHSYSESF